MSTTTTTASLVRTAAEDVTTISPAALEMRQMARGTVILDVREDDELDRQGWIAGAVHVPRGLLEFVADPASPLHMPELAPGAPTVVYCSTGARAALAAALLIDLGFDDVQRLDGGIAAWTRAGLPVAGTRPWHVQPTSPAVAGVHHPHRGARP